MKKPLFAAVFAAGLASVGWVGSGYLASHPLALVTKGAVTRLVTTQNAIQPLVNSRW